MKIFRAMLTVALVLFWANLYAQAPANAVIFHITSSHTSFPDTGRAKGHLYDKVLYTQAEHYNDSTVLIIAPKGLDAKKKVDLIFWFHGWRNNVDTAAVHYQLTRQFLASGLNAVLVLAETTKDAPDSYGGKLENAGVFKALVADVLNGLHSQRLVAKNCEAGHILLAGHSGAYRVMARVIQNGQMPVDETILFDALYAETEKFMAWIKADNAHRFIDIYTDHGGTDDETRGMMKLLDTAKIVYVSTEEKAVTSQMLRDNRLVFIHSLNEHDKIIANPDNFLLYLDNEPFLKKLKNE
ncbi:MAG TPA: hypothetical protein VG367_03315 [Mucilaginibacter sp.]|jgi:hypothetical protein|nr:hypothetical protein [Mucilaginibacter sp.]